MKKFGRTKLFFKSSSKKMMYSLFLTRKVLNFIAKFIQKFLDILCNVPQCETTVFLYFQQDLRSQIWLAYVTKSIDSFHLGKLLSKTKYPFFLYLENRFDQRNNENTHHKSYFTHVTSSAINVAASPLFVTTLCNSVEEVMTYSQIKSLAIDLDIH